MTRRPRTSDKAAHNRTAAARRPASRERVVEPMVVALAVEKRNWLDRVRDWLQSFYGTFGVDIARL